MEWGFDSKSEHISRFLLSIHINFHLYFFLLENWSTLFSYHYFPILNITLEAGWGRVGSQSIL